jgi:ABC-2 type transport system ATP-binding protein
LTKVLDGLYTSIPSSEILKELNIDAKKKNQSQHLSRGMLQKLALGVGLITDPKLLLLDEPTLGLDVESSRKMRDMIRHLTKVEGRSVLLTTHQMDLVEELADRVGILRNGNLVREGSLSELKSIFHSFFYKMKIRGNWNITPSIQKEYSIDKIVKQSDTMEFDFDCKDKNGIFRFLEVIKKENIEIIFFYRLEEDLEEIFLRVLQQ